MAAKLHLQSICRDAPNPTVFSTQEAHPANAVWIDIYRGTTHPLFILRWAMERAEMTANPLYFLFLDWRQAFDSIDHNSMLVALQRFGISSRALHIISSIHKAPRFTLVALTGLKQMARGGFRNQTRMPPQSLCFRMVRTVIFEDMDWSLLSKGIPTNTWSVTSKSLRSLRRKQHSTERNLTTTKPKLSLTPDALPPRFVLQTAHPSRPQFKFLLARVCALWRLPKNSRVSQPSGYEGVFMMWP